jgi:hypothetical protein
MLLSATRRGLVWPRCARCISAFPRSSRAFPRAHVSQAAHAQPTHTTPGLRGHAIFFSFNAGTFPTPSTNTSRTASDWTTPGENESKIRRIPGSHESRPNPILTPTLRPPSAPIRVRWTSPRAAEVPSPSKRQTTARPITYACTVARAATSPVRAPRAVTTTTRGSSVSTLRLRLPLLRRPRPQRRPLPQLPRPCPQTPRSCTQPQHNKTFPGLHFCGPDRLFFGVIFQRFSLFG